MCSWHFVCTCYGAMEEAVQFEGINGSWAVICHSTWKRVPCREPSVPNARAMDGDMYFQSWATFLLGPGAAYGNTGKPHWNSQAESGWKLWVLSVKGLIRVGNLGQVTAQQCWEKLGDLFCCEFYLKTESGQTLQPKEVQEEGMLWWHLHAPSSLSSLSLGIHTLLLP